MEGEGGWRGGRGEAEVIAVKGSGRAVFSVTDTLPRWQRPCGCIEMLRYSLMLLYSFNFIYDGKTPLATLHACFLDLSLRSYFS